MTTLSHSPGSGTVKSNPQSTDFSRHPSSMGNPPKASFPQPDAFVHAPEDQSFLLLPPGQLARSDPRLSHQSAPELAVRLTGTAVPSANAPPQLALGDWLPTSLHRSAPLQPGDTGLPSSPAPLPTRTRPRKAIPRRGSEIFAVGTPLGEADGGRRGQRARGALTAQAALSPAPPARPSARTLPARRPGTSLSARHTPCRPSPPAAPRKMAPTLPSRRDKPTDSLSAHALSGQHPQPRRWAAHAHTPRAACRSNLGVWSFSAHALRLANLGTRSCARQIPI